MRSIALAAVSFSLAVGASGSPARTDAVIKLVARDGQVQAYFGSAVAVHRDTVLVGAEGDDDSGSAYLFDRHTGKTLHKLVPFDGAFQDFFGCAVALTADVAVVGAFGDRALSVPNGAVYLFDPATGTLLTKIVPSDPIAWPGLNFGRTLAVSGDLLAVGVPNGVGSVRLYDIADPAAPVLLGEVTATDGGRLGPVALDGSLLISGASGDGTHGQNSGAAYVFDVSDPGAPMQVAKLHAADATSFDHFGDAVAIQGTTAAVGAPRTPDGSAYVFDLTDPASIPQRKLEPAEWGGIYSVPFLESPHFGASVAVRGTQVLVGAPGAYASDTVGAVHVFDADLDIQLARLEPRDPSSGQAFGRAIATDGLTTVVGARHDDDAGSSSGSAYLFDGGRPDTSEWVCLGRWCPCWNDTDGPGGCANSTWMAGRLSAAGTTSVSADDLMLDATGLPPDVSALVFMGDTLIDVPFFDGRRCAGGSTTVFLGSAQSTGGSGTASFDALVADSQGSIRPGDTWILQCWYRDASPCARGSNVTNAVVAIFRP